MSHMKHFVFTRIMRVYIEAKTVKGAEKVLRGMDVATQAHDIEDTMVCEETGEEWWPKQEAT